MAQQKSIRERRVKECLDQGKKYKGKNRFSEAIKCFEEALELVEELGGTKLETAAYIELGNCYKLNSQVEKAIEYYEKALGSARKRHDKTKEIDALIALGRVHPSAKKQDKANQYFQEALHLAKEQGDILRTYRASEAVKKFFSWIRSKKARLAASGVKRENSSEADNTVGNVGNAHKAEADKKRVFIEGLLSLGLSSHNNDKIEESVKNYEEAAKIADEADHSDLKAKAYQHLGNVYSANSQYMKAIEYYQKAREINTEYKSEKWELTAYMTIGDNYLEACDYKECIKYYNEAVKVASQLGDGRNKINAYFGLGNAFRFTAEYETSRKYFWGALTTAKQMNDNSLQKDAYKYLGHIHYKSCKFDAALRSYLKVREISHNLGKKKEEAHAYLFLGDTFQQLRENEKAIKVFQKALNIGKELEDQEIQMKAAQELRNLKSDLVTDCDHEAIVSCEGALNLFQGDCSANPQVSQENAKASLGVASFNTADTEKAIDSIQGGRTFVQSDAGCRDVKCDSEQKKSSEHMSLSSSVPGNKKIKQKPDEIDEMDAWFKKTFLDSKRKLKDEIHEELKSFPWFCGAYGLAAPNKKIPRLHLFVTVKRGTKKLDVRHDLEEKYKRDPREYFELLQEPKNPPKIRYLGNGSIEGSSQPTVASSVPKVLPSPGGGVLACNSGNPNRSRGSDEDDGDDSHEVQGTGTLTLFCFFEGHHYALTCFHVGCANDEMRYNATFNKVEDIKKIRNSLPIYVLEARRKRYLFTGDLEENNNEPISYGDNGSNYTSLGNFHSYRFDSECDILCLKISNDAKIDCKTKDVGSRDWKSIWDEVIKKFAETTGPLEVGKLQLSPHSSNGHIVSCCVSYGKEEVLFKNAIAVKGCAGPFLENGDSGSLVFINCNNKKPFAYGVCEIDELHLPQHQTGSIDDGSDTSSVWSGEEYSNESISDSEDKLENEALEGAEQSEYKDIQTVEGQINYQKDSECQNYAKCCGKDSDDPEDSEIVFQKDTGPYYICLRLDTALEKLGLDKAACVDRCGQSGEIASHK